MILPRSFTEEELALDPTHDVRLRSDDTWADNLRSWSDLKDQEQAVTLEPLVEKIYGEGSDPDKAAHEMAT